MENLKLLLDSLVDISDMSSSAPGEKARMLAANTEFIRRKITTSLKNQNRPNGEILAHLLKTLLRLTKMYSSNKETNHMTNYSIDFLRRKISSEIASSKRYEPME